MIVKNMTNEMIELSNSMDKLDAYVQALKCGIFVRRKSIVNAINAYGCERGRFWSLVTRTWPELKGLSSTIHADNTIISNDP
jgi:hypothetical protein